MWEKKVAHATCVAFRPTPSAAVTTAPLAHQEMRNQLWGFGTITLGEGATSDVEVTVTLSEHEATIVPRDAVLREGCGECVFAVEGGVVRRLFAGSRGVARRDVES